MMIAAAGRRIDEQGAEIARFPLAKAAFVRGKIKALLDEIKPEIIIASGACGADLLMLEVAGQLGIRRKMILPFGKEIFRAISVVDRPGRWGNLYDRIFDEVQGEKGVMILGYETKDPHAYEKTNQVILEQAKDLSEKGKSAVMAVIIWEGSPKEKDDTTAHFRSAAQGFGFTIRELNTLK